MKDTVFKPSFGNEPNVMVGRDDIIQKLEEVLESDPGSRERALLLLGQRGTGKTVLLLKMEQLAKDHGFIATHPVVAAPGMLEKIYRQIYLQADCLDGKKSLTGGNIGILGFSVGVQFESKKETPSSFSFRIEEICRRLTEIGKGVVFVIDEVQSLDSELREFIITYQSLIGMKLNVTVVFAGLPRTVSSLLQTGALTFLNRAPKEYLQPLKTGEIADYFFDVLNGIPCSITPGQCKTAAKASNGSPYMMQLIGHYIIKSINEQDIISDEILEHAIAHAEEDFNNDICEAVLKDVSEKDLEFLKAASLCEGPEIRAQSIVSLLGVSQAYYQQYKRRMQEAGIISKVRHGVITFSVPYIKDYLRETYASDE